MSEETRLAFDHPVERAKAMSGVQALDRISLRDHIAEVEIGAFQVERGITQRLRFNIVVEVGPVSGDVDDDVDRILSYDRVSEAIAVELKAERLNLLETLAERVAERILLEPPVVRVFVRIEKLDRGPGALGVEIVRGRASTTTVETTDGVTEGEKPRPCLVYLSNTAIGSRNLAGWIDQLVAMGVPLVFCVGPHDLGGPVVGDADAQRRIDLLAIEQNAWVLAARDARCVVVQTRTELDWAMKNGQVSVWAPSKIILDAVADPGADLDTPTGLALWFAKEMDACRVVAIGETLPENIPEIHGLSTQNVTIETVTL